MFNSKSVFVATLLLVLSSQSQANTRVSNDLQRCASQAMNDKQGESYNYQISTGGNTKRDLDHDESRNISLFRMSLSNRSTGSDLGTVSCRIDSSGKILAAYFE